MRVFSTYSISLLCLVILSGCGPSVVHLEEPFPVSPALPLRTEKVQSPVIQAVPLGVLAPLSGPGASYGQDVVEVVKRFAGVFNASHADAHIDVIVENGGCNGKDATIAASKLIDVDKVVAIIGGVCSSETLAAGLLAQEAGMPMIAPGSASSAISAIGDRVVRTNANTAAASVLADAVTEKYRRVLVIAEQKDYPKDMADRFAERVDAEVEMIAFQSDDHDMTVLAKQIALEDADALFVFTQSEATSIPLMLALDEEGLLDRRRGHTYGANNLLVAPFLERLGASAEAMQEVNVGDIDIDYAADDYLASLAGYEVQGDGFTLLQAADAFQQIARVIAEYGETVTAQQIKDYVYSFDEEAPYDGYLGQYWFDNVGDAVGIDFGMYHIVDGEKKVHLGDEHAYIGDTDLSDAMNDTVVTSHPLLDNDRTPTSFTTSVGSLILPIYMIQDLVSVGDDMLELVNVKERYVRDSDPYDPEEQVTIQVLDAASEAYTLRRDAYHACIAGETQKCTHVAKTLSLSTGFGYVKDVVPIIRDGSTIGLGYIGSTYQDVPGSIDIQIVFHKHDHFVYVQQTLYAGTTDNDWVVGAIESLEHGHDDYSAYFDTFVSNSAYAGDIDTILHNMLETIHMQE